MALVGQSIVRNEVVSWPVRQQVKETMEIEKRKDKLVISGIKESDDPEVKVGDIKQEMVYQKASQVVERVGKMEDQERARTDWSGLNWILSMTNGN